MIFEIYNDNKGEFRVRLKADNGEILPDGYTEFHNAANVVKLIKKEVATAKVIRIFPSGNKSDITSQFQ